ncbi:MAG: T9SS type A sorting domain-containing protein [Flavipsychrobacter sp.]
MKKLLLGVFLCSTVLTTKTNAQGYTFKAKTDTYTPITGGSAITGTINLGFDVTIAGVKSSTLHTATYFGQIGTKTPLQFSGFNAEIQDGAKTYSITGNPGDRIVKLQYDKVKFSHNAFGPDYVTFQIWIYEKDNALELHMGASNITNPTLDYYYNTPKGPGVGFSNMWLKGSPANPSTDMSDNFLNGTPANGQVYRFEPATTNISTTINDQNNIQLYPNPGNGLITIAVANNSNSYATVYDMAQRQLIQQPLTQKNNQINMAHLQAGLYTITVSNKDGVQKTFNYVKQ